MRWWDRLSDGELRARLTQRGVNRIYADALVDHRDSCDDCRDEIIEVLGPE